MRLTSAERAYLFQLAERLDPNTESSAGAPDDDAGGIVNAIKTPAYILDRQWDEVAWNRPARELFVGWLSGRRATDEKRNLLRFTFLEASARMLILEWPQRADRPVAEFRADCGKYSDQPPLKDLVSELASASPEFRRLWNSQNVVNREGGERHFLHPQKGELVFEQITLHPTTRRDLKLVVLLPK
jgi:hypothetical protein